MMSNSCKLVVMENNKDPKGNFVWIDLEMTGLNPDTDHILEIATIITDDQLNEIAEGPTIIIHQHDDILFGMGQWCLDQHGKTGLIKASQESTVSVKEAEAQTLDFIKKHCEPQTALLAGSSVWQDRAFMRRYMPSIIDYFYYKQIDVSTVKELVRRWYPDNPHAEYQDKEAHRALDDIRESIDKLKHFRKYFFIES